MREAVGLSLSAVPKLGPSLPALSLKRSGSAVTAEDPAAPPVKPPSKKASVSGPSGSPLNFASLLSPSALDSPGLPSPGGEGRQVDSLRDGLERVSLRSNSPGNAGSSLLLGSPARTVSPPGAALHGAGHPAQGASAWISPDALIQALFAQESFGTVESKASRTLVIDVRSPDAFNRARVKDAINPNIVPIYLKRFERGVVNVTLERCLGEGCRETYAKWLAVLTGCGSKVPSSSPNAGPTQVILLNDSMHEGTEAGPDDSWLAIKFVARVMEQEVAKAPGLAGPTAIRFLHGGFKALQATPQAKLVIWEADDEESLDGSARDTASPPGSDTVSPRSHNPLSPTGSHSSSSGPGKRPALGSLGVHAPLPSFPAKAVPDKRKGSVKLSIHTPTSAAPSKRGSLLPSGVSEPGPLQVPASAHHAGAHHAAPRPRTASLTPRSQAGSLSTLGSTLMSAVSASPRSGVPDAAHAFSPTTAEVMTPFSQIRPYLYVGSEAIFNEPDGLDTLRGLGVTHVLNMAKECDYPKVENSGFFKYMKYGTHDHAGENVDQAIIEALDFIDLARSNPANKVFVHCQAGKSRSVTIVLAHLVKTEKISLREAYREVKARRGVIEPNPAFLGTLLVIEKEVLGVNSNMFEMYQ